jgi:hypothetical protein
MVCQIKHFEGMLKIVNDKLLRSMNYRQQHMKENRLCALWVGGSEDPCLP